MRSLIVILLALVIAKSAYSANPDNAAWLIYDVSYGDYFLLRVEMKTTKTGVATVAGGSKYAGRRYTGQNYQFIVLMHDDGMTISKDPSTPFMVGKFNSYGDEFSGEFVKADGASGGRFVGALQGFTTVQMDLFQLCKSGENYQCVNRGRDENCGNGSYKSKSTFFTEKNCLDAGGIKTLADDSASEEEPKFSEDPTGTWLFYDEYYKEYVVGRLVATNFDKREPDESIEGTYVFSGVYLRPGEFGGEIQWFGRRKMGNSALSDEDRDRFYISKDGDGIMFRHAYDVKFWGKVDLAAGEMAGSWHHEGREPMFGDYRNLGPGYWTAEKKSDDPNFDLPVYQYCSRTQDKDWPGSHYCAKVSNVKADGSGRPVCKFGYRAGSITFLKKEKCEQLRKARLR